MARTKDQSFVNRYLNQYQQNQKSAVSAGQQAASNAASSGVQQMNATGNIEIPSLYDPTEELYGLVLEQQQAQIKAQQAAAKAAQKAQEKAQKEAQERAKEAASESSATSAASNPLANRLSQTRAQSKVTEEEQPKKGLLSTIGDWVSEGLSALSGSNKDAENKASTSGSAGVPARSLAKTATVERPASAYDAMTVTEKLTAAQQLSEQVNALQSQIDALERQKVEPKTGAGAYDEEAYSIIQKNRQIVEQQDALKAQQKQVSDQLSELDDALWKDPEYVSTVQAEINSKSESDRIAQYLDPSYKLNKLEEEDAKKIADRLIKEAYDVPRGATQGQLSDAFDKEVLGRRLNEKISNAAAISAGVVSAIPFAEEADRALSNWLLGENAEKYQEDIPSLENFVVGAKTQSPVAFTAGNIGGNLALYSVGSSAARSIPALQRVGEAAAATPAAQALQKVPVLGRLGTADAITGIYGDTLVDLALDTVPRLGNDILAYNQQQDVINQGLSAGKTMDEIIPSLEEYQGEYLTPGGIAADTLKGVGTNLAFNLGGELVPELLKAGGRNLQQAIEPSAALNGGAETAARAIGNANVPIVENAAQAAQSAADDVVNAWRSGTLTNAQLDTLKPGGVNRAAFEQTTGVKLPDTSSETRKFLRSIDNQQAQVYDEVTNMAQGGALNERTGENAVRGMAENAEPGRDGAGNGDVQGRVPAGGNPVLRQFLTPSENINEAIKRSGATPMELVDTTGNPQFFSFALEQARQTNPNGLMVSGKTVEELSQPGTVTFMSKDGLAGALVTADGDIEAVFKNPRSNARGAGSSLLLNAVNNGGTKLDCYGDGLVYLYNRHGFEPVARVPWNPEYAPDGWTYGPKDVYVMKLSDGLDAEAVASRLGKAEAEGGFHIWSKAELAALPTMDYDQALAYRDSLIAADKQSARAAQSGIAEVFGAASPSLSDGLPESIGAKKAAFGYTEVPSQANTVQSIDERFLRPEDIAAQGGQRQYTHQRISMAQQAEAARQIRQTEADDEIIQRIANKENGGGNVSWEDVSTLGAITRDMDRQLSMFDPKSQEYSDLMAKKLYASDVLQSGVSETGRALQTTQQFTLPERGIMQVQRTITDTADAMEKSHAKAFKQGREAVKEAVEKSTQQAEKAANDVFANSLAGRVSATVNQTPAQIDPEAKVFKDMVNELYRVAKESPLPNRVAGANIPATDKIRAAFENRSGYEEVWDKAKEIVSKRFAGDENALSQLDAYLKNLGDGGLYSADTVRSAVKESASSLGIDFRKLAKQYSTNKDAALRSLTDDIISKTGVSGQDAAELADRIMVAYNQEMNRAIESNLKTALPELFGKTRATQKRAAIDRFVQLLNMGIYNDDTVKQLVASKWGVAPLSVEQATSITTILKEADKLPQGSKARYDLEMQAAAIAAESINTSLLDKWNAWRYMAMLGNVRTNEKNISSNVAQGGLARTKEVVQAMIESGVDAASRAIRGKGIQRTTAIVNPFSAEGKKLLSAALLDADNAVYKDLIGTSEYFDITKQMGRKVFDTKWLENLRKGISGALEGADYYGVPGALDFFKKAFAEDSVAWKSADWLQRKVGMYGEKTAIGISGLRNNYAWSLAEYLKANHLDPSVLNAADDASVQAAAQARAWAIKQALENTYHEESAVASALSNFSKMLMQSDSKGAKTLGVVLEGNFPFKKTPINVLKEALRYSPAGIVEPAVQAVISVIKKGNAPSAAEWADSIAKALTGTGLMALGAYMRSIGLLNSSLDDVAAAGKEGTGEQEYSLRLEDEDGNLASYTIDWLSPIALPLFMGAEYYDRAIKGGEGFLSAITNGVAALADPVTEMTFLSSLNKTLDTFNTVKQSSEPSFALPAAVISAGASYFTQGVPSLLGQVARSVDDTRRSTYTGKTGVPNVVGRQIEGVQNKLLGLSMLNEPYIDQWGNTDENEGGSFLGRLAYNTLSPGFVSIAPADDTIQMLESLDDKSVWPGYAPYSVEYTVDGEKQKKRWTPEEYTQYATSRGQGSREIADAFTYDAAFALLPPDQQAALVNEAYTYADFAAKRELIPSLEEQFQRDILDNPSKTDRLNAIYDEYGADVLVPVLVADEITSNVGADKNSKGNSIPGSREKNFIEILLQYGYTSEEAEYLYQLLK